MLVGGSPKLGPRFHLAVTKIYRAIAFAEMILHGSLHKWDADVEIEYTERSDRPPC